MFKIAISLENIGIYDTQTLIKKKNVGCINSHTNLFPKIYYSSTYFILIKN